ncbi:hypothetical protein BG006_010653 [Podila minutissima]|uniref:Uncharacterized protein n=1 Tax=Podila minutissima TaxID=64525 RepID=A0A9P5VIL8_9FUNG|nr:hypothetical protein BG006_010653 [Podila minutissima]
MLVRRAVSMIVIRVGRSGSEVESSIRSWRTFALALKIVFALYLGTAMVRIAIVVLWHNIRTIHAVHPIKGGEGDNNNPKDLLRCGKWGDPEKGLCHVDGATVAVDLVVGLLAISEAFLSFVDRRDRRARSKAKSVEAGTKH